MIIIPLSMSTIALILIISLVVYIAAMERSEKKDNESYKKQIAICKRLRKEAKKL